MNAFGFFSIVLAAVLPGFLEEGGADVGAYSVAGRPPTLLGVRSAATGMPRSSSAGWGGGVGAAWAGTILTCPHLGHLNFLPAELAATRSLPEQDVHSTMILSG